MDGEVPSSAKQLTYIISKFTAINFLGGGLLRLCITHMPCPIYIRQAKNPCLWHGLWTCWGLHLLDLWRLHPSSQYVVYPSSQHIVYPSSQYIVYPSSQYIVYPSQQYIVYPSQQLMGVLIEFSSTVLRVDVDL